MATTRPFISHLHQCQLSFPRGSSECSLRKQSNRKLHSNLLCAGRLQGPQFEVTLRRGGLGISSLREREMCRILTRLENPSEFDITDVVNNDSTENTLAVRVYQYCDGSYIEDQDQWRMSGIFRDVFLLAFPTICIKDFHVNCTLDADYRDGILEVKLEADGEDQLELELLDAEQKSVISDTRQISSDGIIRLEIDKPQKWTAETPYLYHLLLSFGGHTIVQKVGFRNIEIKDGLYVVNGSRVVFRGANRHEHPSSVWQICPVRVLERRLAAHEEEQHKRSSNLSSAKRPSTLRSLRRNWALGHGRSGPGMPWIHQPLRRSPART